MLDVEQVGTLLGLSVQKHQALCPFHRENTPSLRFYDNHYYCFGCGSSGDAIKLAAEILNVKPIKAAEMLNDAFNVGLNFRSKGLPEDIQKVRKMRQNDVLLGEWHRSAVRTLSDYIQACYSVANSGTTDEKIRSKGWSETERVEALQDKIFSLKPEAAFETYKREVRELEERLQRRKRIARQFGIE